MNPRPDDFGTVPPPPPVDDRCADDGASPDALCDGDCEALEALCATGFDCSCVPEHLRGRAEVVARLLGLLSRTDPSNSPVDPALIDATCAQADRLRRVASPELSPRDEDALEALVCTGLNPARCPVPLRSRAEHQHALLSMLDVRIDQSARAALVSATLSRVQSNADDQRSRMTIHAESRVVRARFRWQDLVTVAALLLVSFGVLTPMLAAVRGYSQQAACSTNMAVAGLGFGQYALDFKDALPMATASLPGSPWWNVGRPEQSNAANLFTMVRTGYTPQDRLACAGNPSACREQPAPGAADWRSLDQVSYSYQNLFAPPTHRATWTMPATIVVLADRSPLVPKSIAGEPIHPLDNSLNHAGRGQTVLFNDRSARFVRTPVLASGDNIWLPRVVEQFIARHQNPNQAEPLRGTETPVGADDVFLGP